MAPPRATPPPMPGVLQRLQPLVFTDIAERETAEKARINAKIELLKKTDPQGARELEKRKKALGAKPFDALLVEVVEAAKAGLFPKAGRFPSQAKPGKPLTADERKVAGVYGILVRDRHFPPALDDQRYGNRNEDVYARFSKDLYEAIGEYEHNEKRFANSLSVLREQDQDDKRDAVDAEVWARVVRTLAEQRVDPKNTYFKLQTENALEGAQSIGEGLPPSAIEIDLPDLEQQADLEIVEANLHAMQAIFFAATLEELRLFQVVDKLIELFQQGMLPLGRGPAGNQLYAYWKKTIERMTEIERRNLYARTFGFPGGDAQVDANREFQDLWLRFVSAVSAFYRQVSVDELLRAERTRGPASVTQELVRKSGRDLAANLSLHGYGVAYFAATELQETIKDAIAILSDDEVKTSYGARDMFQVIDQVATLELPGGARNSIRYRTMATAGAVIIRWLADRAEQLAAVAGSPILTLNPANRTSKTFRTTKPTTHPTDQDLLDACEQWLAVTGTSEDRIEQYAQPAEGPNMTSRPIQIPAAVREVLDSQRDLLESVGVSTNGRTG